jgi:tetratricopeptide (TPR) repeat protein
VELGGPQAETLAYRAAAYRYLGDLPQARNDADYAIALNPKLPEAYLERANVERLTNDPNGARKDWLKVIELAPNSAAADSARDNIEHLDLRVEPIPEAR